jgi:hypothetical protein
MASTIKVIPKKQVTVYDAEREERIIVQAD